MHKATQTVLRVLGIAAAIVVVILGFWLAAGTKLNLGAILERLLGLKKPPRRVPVTEGTGILVAIVPDMNPLRNKTEVKLSDGEVVTLPKGVQDTDIETVVRVSPGEYRVETKSTKLTDRFKI